MQFVSNITANELDSFVYKQPYAHYMHASSFANFKSKEENCSIHYTALMDQDTIVATAIILEYNEPFIGSYMYIPCGICMDYTNQTVLTEYANHLIKYAKEHKAFALYIDPNVIHQEHTLEGEIIPDGINNDPLTKYIESLGFKHRGYNYGYDGSKRNRFTLIIDIDKPYSEVLKNMPKSKQAYFKRQAKMAIEVKKCGKEAASTFALFARELAEIQHFTPHTKDYFEKLFDIYGQNAHGYTCIVDFKKQVEIYEEELASGKYNKDVEAKQSVEKNLAKTREYQNQYGDTAILGTAFYVTCNETSYNLFNYNNKEIPMYRGCDLIHNHVIQDMQTKGIKHYDMVGFSGSVDKNDLHYPLYEFKKSFGPEYIEHIGEFCYELCPTRLKVSKGFKEAKRLLNRLKQKLKK